MDINGDHYCSACAQLAVLSTPDSFGSGTRAAPARRSSRGKAPGRRSIPSVPPPHRLSTTMTTPHRMPGYQGPAIPAWLNLIKPLAILVLLAGAGYWVVTRKQASDAEDARKQAEAAQVAPTSEEQARLRRIAEPGPKDPSPVKTATQPARKERPKPATNTSAGSPGPSTSRSDPIGLRQPPEPPAPVALDLPESHLTKGLEEAIQLVKDSRYGTARKLLRELENGHEKKAWWAKHEREWSDVSKELKQQWKELEDEGKDAREILEKPSREAIEGIVEGWKQYAALDDELSGELGKQILHEAARARIKVIELARNARLVKIEEQLTEFEKTMKSSPGSRKQEMLNFLSELDEEILQNPTWEDRLAPRVIGLRFDVRRARDGDLLIYRAISRAQGATAELLYDFSTLEQFTAWSYNSPEQNEKSNCATWDPTAKSVVLRSTGSHDWQRKERSGMPFLCLPLDFKSWSVEADVEVQVLGTADTGLLVWEGGTNVLLFGVREQTDKKGNKEWLLTADGCLGKKENYQKELAHVPVPEKNGLKLFLAFDGSNLALGATVGTRAVNIQDRTHLPFKANYLGLYVRTRGTDATAAFTRVKLNIVPDPQMLRSKADLARQVEVNTAKDEWRKQAQTARVARDQAAGVIPKEWFSAWTCATAEACPECPDRPTARTTRPTNPAALPYWSRRVKLEPYKTHYVHADVAAPRDTDWGVAVRVNSKDIASKVVVGTSWQMLDVDLTPYGGEEILLEISHRPASTPDAGTAYWDRIYVGSR